MGEIKKRAAENRRKELEGTLDFFLAHMKQHAFVMPVFPVNTPDAPRNGKSAGTDVMFFPFVLYKIK